MAEILIFKEGNGNQSSGAFQKGDIWGVFEDGTMKEKPSPNSKFILVITSGVAPNKFRNYLVRDNEEYFDPKTEQIETRIRNRRKEYFDLDILSKTNKDRLDKDRQIKLTENEITINIKSR